MNNRVKELLGELEITTFAIPTEEHDFYYRLGQAAESDPELEEAAELHLMSLSDDY